MAKTAGKRAPAVVLVYGKDESAVTERAKQICQEWCDQLGEFDREIIDGTATKADEALKVISRVREALLTLPFFGSGKVIWLRNCNFLGTERTATAQVVTEAVDELARALEDFDWSKPGNVRFIISTTDVDRRRRLARVVEKIGSVEPCAGWSLDDKDWAQMAEAWVKQRIYAHKKQIAEEAVAELVARVGPDQRMLDSEIQKLVLYVGTRPKIQIEDVETICIRNKFAGAFALADALGARDLPALLRHLDEELWQMQFDKDKNEFSLLGGLVTKIRALIFAKEMLRAGWVKQVNYFNQFTPFLKNVPQDRLPADPRFNPLALHPYVLFKAVQQANNYTLDELVRAMDMLLQCNQKLIYSDLDARLVLQQTLIDIVSRTPGQEKHPG